MKKTLQVIFDDIRNLVNSFSGWWKIGFVLVLFLIVMRVLFPVLHMNNGYVLYLYPFFEHEICLSEVCSIDRSRTFAAVGTLAMTFLGLWYIQNNKRNGN